MLGPSLRIRKKFEYPPWDFLVPPPGPGEMLKGQISLNYNNKINFKDFIPKIVCCLTDKRYKTCQTRFLS